MVHNVEKHKGKYEPQIAKTNKRGVSFNKKNCRRSMWALFRIKTALAKIGDIFKAKSHHTVLVDRL